MNIIKSLRLKKGLTQSELASICGVHQTAVSQWEKGRTLPDKQTLLKLSEAFGVTVDALMGVGGSAERKNLIPVLGFVRAGTPVEAVEDIIGYEEISDELEASGEHFALKVRGDSMMPEICPDDIAIVRKQDYIESGEIGVVLVNNLDATIKKVIIKGDSLTLVPFNNAYDPMIFNSAEIASLPVRIIGKVVELRRKFI